MIQDVRPCVDVFSESGVNPAGVDVQLVSLSDGLRIDLAASGEAVTKIVCRWSRGLPRGLRLLGDHWERAYGDLEWRGYVPERVLPWYVLCFDPQSGVTSGMGVETGAGAFASWRVDPEGVELTLDVRNGGAGVRLGERVLAVATVRTLASEAGETPFAFACRFCRCLCDHPRLPAFPVYGANDWYYAYGDNSADSVRRDAALVRDLSPNRDNAPFMVIDAGWFPARECNGGPYVAGNDRFPDMPGLAADLNALDVRPGIWVRPLMTADAPDAWKLPAVHPVWHRVGQVVMDPSVPEVLQQVRTDIARLQDWGYGLIKHDFTTFDLLGLWGGEMRDGLVYGEPWHFADTSLTTAEIVRNLYRAIREAAGDALLIGCNTIGHLGAGLFELQRTGDDTSGKAWERTRRMGVNTLAFRMPQHEAFFAADADCVGLTEAVPWDMNRQWLDLLAASGTPLFVSADPKAVGPEQRAALSDAFARAAVPQPAAEPLDWMDTTCPGRWRFGNDVQDFSWRTESV